jgi:hypothetical protein
VAVQEVRCVDGDIQSTDNYTLLYRNGNVNHRLGTGFFIRKGIRSAVKRLEFINDRMSYITRRGRWCDIVLNVHAPNEDKSDDTKEKCDNEL